MDLSKQQALDADPKAIKQINFTKNLVQNPVTNTTMFFIIEEAKKTILISYQHKMTLNVTL